MRISWPMDELLLLNCIIALLHEPQMVSEIKILCPCLDYSMHRLLV